MRNFASGRRDQGTDGENKATVQGSLAYAGTYAVDHGNLSMKIEASTYPNEEGAEQKPNLHVERRRSIMEESNRFDGGLRRRQVQASQVILDSESWR